MALPRDVLAEVRRIIAVQLEIDPKEIHPESKLIDDLGTDSLGIVELILSFQEEFGLDVPDEDVERISTVQDIVTYLEKWPPSPETL
jgi:acyl carrier protein